MSNHRTRYSEEDKERVKRQQHVMMAASNNWGIDRLENGRWVPDERPVWNWSEYDYRVSPQSPGAAAAFYYDTEKGDSGISKEEFIRIAALGSNWQVVYGEGSMYRR